MSSTVSSEGNKLCDASNMVWIDCEMTGLDAQTDQLLEIAVIVTDKDLNILAEGPNLIIYQPNEVLDSMHEWCVEQHGLSGLTEKCRQSQLSVAECETQILDFLKKFTPPGECPLAGNVVSTDKRFLIHYMPDLMKHLDYKIVDVTSIRLLVERWYPKALEGKPEKKSNHRALDDIRESIEELKYYRTVVFKDQIEK